MYIISKKTKVIDVISLACISSETHNLQAVFLSIYDTETSYPRAAVQNTGVKTFQSLTLTASFEILVDLEMGLTVQIEPCPFFSVKTDVSGKHSIFNAFVADFCHHFNCKLSELSILNYTP